MKVDLKTIIAEMKKSIIGWIYPNYLDKAICEIVTEILEEKLKQLEDFEAKIQREVKLMDGDVKRGEMHEGFPFWIREQILGMTEEEILKE